MTDTNRLHLPDLTIKGFRGIGDLSISRLGRVTLLAGKNSVGKTTVLDAVRVYAARGRYDALRSLLEDREEMTVATNEDGDNSLLPDLEALFHGRDVSQSACISIGTKDVADRLTITTTALSDEQTDYHDPISDFVPAEAVKAVYRSNEQVLPWTFLLNDYSTHLVPSQLNYEKDIVGAVCHEHPGWKSASRWRHEPYCVPLRAHGHVASGQSHPGHAVADNYG